MFVEHDVITQRNGKHMIVQNMLAARLEFFSKTTKTILTELFLLTNLQNKKKALVNNICVYLF